MRNVWIICRKELRSYFVSPVAYLLLAMFAVIFGFFFWNILGFFVYRGMEMQMRGQGFPMNLNEEVIRPLLSNVSVIGNRLHGKALSIEVFGFTTAPRTGYDIENNVSDTPSKSAYGMGMIRLRNVTNSVVKNNVAPVGGLGKPDASFHLRFHLRNDVGFVGG